jgi:hypothetical protein
MAGRENKHVENFVQEPRQGKNLLETHMRSRDDIIKTSLKKTVWNIVDFNHLKTCFRERASINKITKFRVP